MTEKVKNDYKLKRSEPEPKFSVFFGVSATVTIFITLITPNINFEAGVFGFCVLICWLIYAIVNTLREWHPVKVGLMLFVPMMSAQLLCYTSLFVLFSLFPCDSCFA